MSARKARTEAAAVGAAPVDSEEKDVKIPVEAVDDTEANEAAAAEAVENQVEDSNKEATMTEDEMVEAAIRAGEEAADNDFKLKFEQAQKELADVRSELDAAAEAQKAAEDKAKDATERTARLQADWEALSPSTPRARRSIRSSTRPWVASRTRRSTTRLSTTCTRRATAWRTASCVPRW